MPPAWHRSRSPGSRQVRRRRSGSFDGLGLRFANPNADLEQLSGEIPGAPILGNVRLGLIDGVGRDDAGPGLALDGPGQRPVRSVTGISVAGTVAGGLAALAVTRCQRAGARVPAQLAHGLGDAEHPALDEADGEAPQPGHVLRPVPGADAAAILVETPIEDVMLRRDRPMPAIERQQPFRGGRLRGARLVTPQAVSMRRFPDFTSPASRRTAKTCPTPGKFR